MVAASRGYSSLQCMASCGGFSLQSMGSRHASFISGHTGSVVVAHGPRAQKLGSWNLPRPGI